MNVHCSCKNQKNLKIISLYLVEIHVDTLIYFIVFEQFHKIFYKLLFFVLFIKLYNLEKQINFK